MPLGWDTQCKLHGCVWGHVGYCTPLAAVNSYFPLATFYICVTPIEIHGNSKEEAWKSGTFIRTKILLGQILQVLRKIIIP